MEDGIYVFTHSDWSQSGFLKMFLSIDFQEISDGLDNATTHVSESTKTNVVLWKTFWIHEISFF